MTEPSFPQIYPAAAELYTESGFDLDAVESEFGGRSDWEIIRNWLLGNGPPHPICVPGESGDWYRLSIRHEYWPAHLELLMRKPEWDEDSIQSVDIASTNVVNRIFDPRFEGPIKVHGLVIGHIQSGKTANYTAVIAKAADTGYNLFIVLTGLYNDLRDQTQSRISKELTGTLADPRGHHLDSRDFGVIWKEETTLGHDFHNLDHVSETEPTRPTIAVIKKNVNPLEKIIEWVRGFDSEVASNLNVLIIDDEADHASVNTMTGEEIDEYSGEPERSPSRINELLRTLINILPRVSYVGYTATPFANVFIDPDEEDEELGLTLYPRDFIVSLQKPDDHFGLEDVFPSDPESEHDFHVVIVPQEEADTLREMTEEDRPTLEVPESMREAIRDYLISGSIIRVRGGLNHHHTMMIHTKHTINTMTPLRKRVNAIIQDFEVNLPNTSSRRGIQLLAELKSRWESEFQSKGCEEEWGEVRAQLLTWISRDAPLVYEINMDSTDRMDFDAYEGTGLKAIAVGGNRLSRGLTLEGLCVSLFVRPTTTHDTLMQMSRWFGFREEYSDLIRVFVTADIYDRFSGMVEVERELRDDLERYEQQNELTPYDFGVRVLQQHGMHPTRPGARRNIGLLRSGSNEGQKIHFTESFHFGNPSSLRGNLSQLASLILTLEEPTRIGNRGKSFLWKGVGPDDIVEFIEGLDYPDQNPWPVESILSHIGDRVARTDDELSSWSLVLIGLENGTRKTPLSDFGIDLDLVLPRRTRKAQKDGVGWIAGSVDTVVDLEYPLSEFNGRNGKFSYNKMWGRRRPSNPLLLAYIIDKESRVGGHSGGREATMARTDLFREREEPVDVLGLALVFPQAAISQDERLLMRDYWIRNNAEPFPGL